MSYLVIARKWRPQSFEDVVGQSHVTRTLQNAISAGRVAHAYLFTGPRGVGKTTTARILAKALNCEKGPTPAPCQQCPACLEIAGPGSVDVMEIDGASNNSVDDIRNLREKVAYSGVRDRHKVYIIDEVHMLSPAAFNALLKTLEEPPSHVIFIFATTEVQKLPATILSRTQRFDFRRVAAAELAAQLGRILHAEGLEASAEALQLVARSGGGSVRDSQTLLDQVISFALGSAEKRALRVEDVLAVLGGVQESQALGALDAALKGDAAGALQWLNQQYERGADLRQVLDAFQALLRGLMLAKADPDHAPNAELLPETSQALRPLAAGLGMSRIFSALKACNEAENQLRYSNQARLVLELLLVRLGPASPGAGLAEIVDELRDLEQKLRSQPASRGPALSEGVSFARAEGAAPGQARAASQEDVATTGDDGRDDGAQGPPDGAGVPQPAVDEVEVAATPAALDLARVQADWAAVCQRAQERSMNLAAAANGSTLQALQGGVLSLRVSNEYQRKVLEAPSEREQLEAVLKEQFGQALRVQVAFAQAAPKASKGGKPAPEQVERLLRERPEVRRVQELFGAEIVEIKEEE
jgi:DNA polymerase III subunit gamma/tau